MNDYRLTHIKDYKDAIGAPVKIISGEYKGHTGFINDVFQSITHHGPCVVEICLPNAREVPFGYGEDGFDLQDVTLFVSDFWNSCFAIDITLKAGKKYITMNGDIVTMLKNKYGEGFHVNNSEVTGDPNNESTESYEPNGFAYHYDCGCNILKEYVEEKPNFGCGLVI